MRPVNHDDVRTVSWFVYLVRCVDGSLYCGVCTEPARRVKEHNTCNRGARYTRCRRPVALVWHKGFESRSDACREEARIKRLSRSDKERLIQEGTAAEEKIGMRIREPTRRRRLDHRACHWVRVTRSCNNRCLFCLDSEELSGRPCTSEEVEAAILEGRGLGAHRLVLSGGEPTLHPRFSELVGFARKAGFPWIQAVTNGRMFAYGGFCRKAASAGLDEATVSLHGDSALLHDRLAGVPGAFEQTMRGIKNLLHIPGVTVTVDIVICRANLHRLGHMVELLRGEGVKELDLLWLRDCRSVRMHRDELALEREGSAWVDEAVLVVERVVERARALDLLVHPASFPLDVLERIEGLKGGEGVATRSDPSGGDGAENEEICHLDLKEDGRAFLVIRNPCSNACTFCTTRIINQGNAGPWVTDPTPKVIRTIEEIRRRGYRKLHLPALEPLEHPGILSIISAARDLGFHPIEIWSHAGPLSDPRFARAVVEAGMTHLDVPVFGPGPEVHDLIAGRASAYEETLAGLSCLRDLGFKGISSHMVVALGNHLHLADTYLSCVSSAFGPIKSLVLAAPSSADPEVFRPVAAPLSELVDALLLARPRIPKRVFTGILDQLARNVPLCLLLSRFPDASLLLRSKEPPDSSGVVETKEYLKGLEGEGRRALGFDFKRRSECPKAVGCAVRALCPGVFNAYIELFGDGELEPVIE